MRRGYAKICIALLFLGRSVRNRPGPGYFGRVIAPSEADETSAAYFANTPVG